MVFRILDYISCRLAYAIVCLMSILPRRNLFGKDNRKHILVIGNDRVGDILIRLPFYQALRNAFPKDAWHISITLPSYIVSTVSVLSYFDEVVETPIQWDNHALRWIFKKGTFISSTLRWAFCHKVDMLIAPVRFRALGCDLVHKLTTPQFSISYSVDKDWNAYPMSASFQKRMYDRRYTYLISPKAGRHQLDDLSEMLSIAISSGEKINPLFVRRCKMVMHPMEEWHAIVDIEYMQNFKRGQYAVFVPGASATIRQWSAESLAELAECIGENVIIVGNNLEHPLGEVIINQAKAKVVNLCGKTTIAQLGGVLLNAKFVVTNETGTATYAAVLGAPTVCILGGGDFGAFFPNPYYKNTVSVFHKEGCYYCGWKCKKTNLDVGKTAPCINAISVEEVMAAIASLSENNTEKDSCDASRD